MEDENFSSLEIPHPSMLVQPVVYFLVVTRGPQVGVFGVEECKQVELAQLLSGREYAFRDFEDWRSALWYYRQCFESNDISILGSGTVALCEGRHNNSSGEHIPHPDSLVEPERSFLVVTMGHKVGIFNEPGQIDLQRLFSTPGYALRHFSYWKPAYRYYKANFNSGEVVLTARRKKRQRPISTDFSEYTDYVSDIDIIPATSRSQRTHTQVKLAATRVLKSPKREEYDIAVFGAVGFPSKGPNPFKLDRFERSVTKNALASSSKGEQVEGSTAD